MHCMNIGNMGIISTWTQKPCKCMCDVHCNKPLRQSSMAGIASRCDNKWAKDVAGVEQLVGLGVVEIAVVHLENNAMWRSVLQ